MVAQRTAGTRLLPRRRHLRPPLLDLQGRHRAGCGRRAALVHAWSLCMNTTVSSVSCYLSHAEFAMVSGGGAENAARCRRPVSHHIAVHDRRASRANKTIETTQPFV